MQMHAACTTARALASSATAHLPCVPAGAANPRARPAPGAHGQLSARHCWRPVLLLALADGGGSVWRNRTGGQAAGLSCILPALLPRLGHLCPFLLSLFLLLLFLPPAPRCSHKCAA